MSNLIILSVSVSLYLVEIITLPTLFGCDEKVFKLAQIKCLEKYTSHYKLYISDIYYLDYYSVSQVLYTPCFLLNKLVRAILLLSQNI